MEIHILIKTSFVMFITLVPDLQKIATANLLIHYLWLGPRTGLTVLTKFSAIFFLLILVNILWNISNNALTMFTMSLRRCWKHQTLPPFSSSLCPPPPPPQKKKKKKKKREKICINLWIPAMMYTISHVTLVIAIKTDLQAINFLYLIFHV